MLVSVQVTCVTTMLFVGLQIEGAERTGRIGVYHWGGERTKSMAEGIDRIASLGGRVARVAYSPRYYSDYGIGAGCYPDFSLARLAQEPDVERALNDARIQVLILTAYDGLTFGDCQTHRYINPGFYTPENISALRAEYAEFVLHLFRRYGGSGRRFIISNWEGDNTIYCGEGYSYVVNEEFRRACDENYPVYYNGNTSPVESLEGMRLWLRTRQEGIRDGIEQGRSLGLAEVEVLHAPEISLVRSLEERGIRGVLYDVLPAIRPDYVSYSSYESLNREDPAGELAADIATIRSVTGASSIIIGEAGYSRAIWGASGVARLRAAIQSALDSGVAYFVYWNLNDQSALVNCGMFDTADRPTASGLLIEGALQSELR